MVLYHPATKKSRLFSADDKTDRETRLFGRRAGVRDLVGVDADAGAHGRADDAGTDVLTLRGGGLRLYDRVKQGVEVLRELLGAEGRSAYRAVDDVRLVKTVLDLTGRIQSSTSSVLSSMP